MGIGLTGQKEEITESMPSATYTPSRRRTSPSSVYCIRTRIDDDPFAYPVVRYSAKWCCRICLAVCDFIFWTGSQRESIYAGLFSIILTTVRKFLVGAI